MRQLLSQIIRKDTIGTCQTVFHNRRATLNQLHIHPLYRHNGYGTQLLCITEQCLFHKYNVQSVITLIWQPQSERITYFYEKNGYTPLPNKTIQHFDDGETIYELMPYEKNLDMHSIVHLNADCSMRNEIHFTDYVI